MGTGYSVYVRLKDPVSDLKNIRKAIKANRKAKVRESEPGKQFIEVEWNGFKIEPTVLEQLSKEIETDVIWLSFQSVVDAFRYEHWLDGKCLRALTFGCGHDERTWERLEGAAEKWEPLEVRHGKIGASGNLDGRETARLVAEHYDLPGWS